jgi:hypothetical protein
VPLGEPGCADSGLVPRYACNNRVVTDQPLDALAEDARERRQRDRIGLTLSLAIHFLALLYIVSILPRLTIERQQPLEQVVTITTRPLTIEKRSKPHLRTHRTAHFAGAPARASQPAPAAVRVPLTPVLPVLPVPRSLGHISVPRSKTTLAFVPHGQAPPPRSQPEHAPQYSGARLAQITRDLGAAIAADRAASGNVLAGTASQPNYEKHYAADDSAFTAGGLGSRGNCSPIKSWEADGYNYYFVNCNVRFSDGTFEVEPVPWPVRFKPNKDPFDGTFAGFSPLAMPLPGWTLPPGETVGKGLRQYAVDHGVELPE